MNKPLVTYRNILLVIITLLPACRQNNPKADIPDVESLYSNISYLDSLIRMPRIDSISTVNDQLTATVQTYANQAQSPEDKAILDSLTRIHSVTSDFLRFCSDTRANLELLNQDIKTLETQYRSGKIKIGFYISSLLEEEQVLIDISNQFSSKSETATEYLKNRSLLINHLTPLNFQGY